MMSDLHNEGFHLIPNFLSPSSLPEIQLEIDQLILENYTEKNLLSNAAYLSDSTETRTSNAFLISKKPSKLPSIVLPDKKIKCIFESSVDLFKEIHPHITPDSRFMVNFQDYKSQSKEVPWHFDGHYIDYETTSDGGFKLLEGILASHVMVVNLHNKNRGKIQGLFLKDLNTGKMIIPDCPPGSAIIFDNIRMRHSVPQLESSRGIIGFRNFDFGSFHFLSHQKDKNYKELPDSGSPGFVKPLSFHEATANFRKYYENVWPQHRNKVLSEGAVF